MPGKFHCCFSLSHVLHSVRVSYSVPSIIHQKVVASFFWGTKNNLFFLITDNIVHNQKKCVVNSILQYHHLQVEKISPTYTTNSTYLQCILITFLLFSSTKSVVSACIQTSSVPLMTVSPSDQCSHWLHILSLGKDIFHVENILNATTVLLYIFHLISWLYLHLFTNK